MSAAQHAFQILGGEVSQFLVVRFRGTDGLCQLYRFEIDLVCTDEKVDFESFVGKSAVLSINTANGARWFHGIISRFEHTNETVGQSSYRAELVPAVWLLTHKYGSRIFQNKTVPEIIAAVLEKSGLSGNRVRIGPFQGKHEPREYCVQYRETDYNFICRLMEEEGIWWFFEQTQDGHVFAAADSVSGYKALEGDAKLRYQPPTGLNVEEEHVFRFRRSCSVRPGAVVLRDFNFENPPLDLEVKSDCQRDAGLEFSDYPGEYLQQDAGGELARLRAEEFEAGRTLGVGQSNSPRLAPACTFELTHHPSDACSDKYLITSLVHQGRQSTTRTTTGSNGRHSLLDARVHQSLIAARQNDNMMIRELAEGLLQIASRLRRGDPTAHRALSKWVFHAGQVSKDLSTVASALGSDPSAVLSVANLLEDPSDGTSIDEDASEYECRFECIPSRLAYRPPRVTPWPVMRGSQTARVVGPKGEEIHTDKYGRVKVQFNWDREGKFDDKSSCWIRVSQGLAGGQYGIMFIPRVGQEVIVDFLEGDPDRPMITGRVYNADQMPPYTLPDEKTKSVIKTHSTKGGGGTNEIRFEDLKDKEQILLYAQKDLHVRVNNDRVESIDHDDHLTVREHKYELVKKSRHSEVKLDLIERIGGKQLLEVKGDLGEEIKGNHSEQVGAYYLHAGKKIVIEAGSEITLKVGGNFVKIDADGVTILGTKVKVNSGGSPGIGSAIAIAAPQEPLLADTVKPGKDVTYTGGETLGLSEVPPDVKGHESKPSWIEIEMVDEEGQPVVGEVIELLGPQGEKLSGVTGEDGVAHIRVPEQGNCEISFVNLDPAAWERIG